LIPDRRPWLAIAAMIAALSFSIGVVLFVP
jgi:hypothetical protein